MKIGNYDIGSQGAFIVAELSANHGHDLNIAKKTIFAAKEAGADAIKLQTYTADTITIDSSKEWFRLKSGTIWDGQTLYELYSNAYTPWEWHKELFDYANEIGIICFSSPFDLTAVDFLEDLNTPAYKIASFEIVDIPLIKHAAAKGKPMIISTGTADLSDVYEAVSACREVGNNNIILLQCASQYPSNLEDLNLMTMKNMKETFQVEVGLSDHTKSNAPAIVATTLGAVMIEKHFILDKSIKSADSDFSLDKCEFAEMVNLIRDAEKSIGIVNYNMTKEKQIAKSLGRSLFVVQDIKKGDIFSPENVRSIRPGNGISPKYYSRVIGKHATKDIERGTPFDWGFIEN